MSPTVANLDDPHLERTSCKPKPTSPKTSKRTIIQAKNLFILDLILKVNYLYTNPLIVLIQYKFF